MNTFEELYNAWEKMSDSVESRPRLQKCLNSADVLIDEENRFFFSVEDLAQKKWIKYNLLDQFRKDIELYSGKTLTSLDVLLVDELNSLRSNYGDNKIVFIPGQKDFRPKGTKDNSIVSSILFRNQNQSPTHYCWFCGKPSDTTITVDLNLDKYNYLRMVHKRGSSKIQIPICNSCKQLDVPDQLSEPTSKASKVLGVLITAVCVAAGELLFFLVFHTGMTVLGKILFGIGLGIGLMVLFYWILSIIDEKRHPEEASKKERFMARIREYPEVSRLIKKDYDIWGIS